MNDYKKIYDNIKNGSIYINQSYTDFIIRLDSKVHFYSNVDDITSNKFFELMEPIINTNIDFDLIDNSFLALFRICDKNLLNFTDIIKAVFIPESIEHIGTYMETISLFILAYLTRSFVPDDLIKNLKYTKIYDLYNCYQGYVKNYIKDFEYKIDHDFPMLLIGYYYQNDMDLNDYNKAIEFYIKNRSFYIEKMRLNGFYYPYIEDDIPKYFNRGYKEIYEQFIPSFISDFKNSRLHKKNIK